MRDASTFFPFVACRGEAPMLLAGRAAGHERTSRLVGLGAAAVFAASCVAQVSPPPSYGIDFVTVGAPGNAPVTDLSPFPLSPVPGRGQVDYTFRIGRTEITTGQWLEFVNTFATQPGTPINTLGATFWGAEPDPGYHGPGYRYRLRSDVATPAMLPVAGIAWRDAARYCNWLENGKGPSLDTLVTGAYDTTTFGEGPGGVFTDPLTHLPGAQYWIPTLDEHLKATNYDPDRFGAGQGGWWHNMNRSDDPGTPGPPGVGTTSAGWDDPLQQWGEWNIPLGAYPQSLSPWGLLDTSGGATEWTEEVFQPGRPVERGLRGSYAGRPGLWLFDSLFAVTSNHPDFGVVTEGFRIASAVPSPGAAGVVVVVLCFAPRRRRNA
jgi:hypothetical protein